MKVWGGGGHVTGGRGTVDETLGLGGRNHGESA